MSGDYWGVSVGSKLQIRAGSSVEVVGLPDGVELEISDAGGVTREAGATTAVDVVIAFVRDKAALDTVARSAIAAAVADRLAWIAYPKSGKLGTDLNRDILAQLAERHGIQPVRQIAIDDTWSALRFRPS
jgi:hypothetical protein